MITCISAILDRLYIMMRCDGCKQAQLLPIPSFVPYTRRRRREREKGKNINGARKEEDHKPQANPDTHCTQEEQRKHVHMLHKAYTVLNLRRHLAHLTETLTKPATKTHISTSTQMQATAHAQRNCWNFFHPSSRSTEINKTVNQRNEYSKKDAAPLSPPFAKTKG